MKRLLFITITIATILCLVHCKKQENQIVASEEKVHITLDVSGGSKVIIEPETGVTAFENGDIVYVANDGQYLGTLTYSYGLFGGDISSPSEDDYLHFYFMGNKTPHETLNDETTSLTVDITDQTTSYPEIAYAHSTILYSAGTSAYSARLLNKCALVKFVANTATSSVITITGMKNKVSVNLSTNEFVYSKEGNGSIQLASGSDTRWAILLPQAEVTNGGVYADGYTGTLGTIPLITLNAHVTTGVAITLSPCVPEGAICGKFTINANGNQVYFSQGNLQYVGSSCTWQFAEHQYEYLGTTTGQNSTTATANRDLFGWGTTGFQDTRTSSTGYQTNFEPYSTSTISVESSHPAYNNNPYGYGPDYDSSNKYCLTVTNKSDWGMHAITNGGNSAEMWRTLTRDEWNYIFNIRSTTTEVRYAKAIVNDVCGVILLPDNWSTSFYTLSSTNNANAAFTNNTINLSDWNTKFEANGAVFLPAAGYRNGTSVYDVDSYGAYWSSDCDNYSGLADYVFFSSSLLTPSNYTSRFYGISVRLIHDIK